MQTPKACAAVDALFKASPKEPGRAFLSRAVQPKPERALNLLTEQFDALFAQMQTPKARAGAMRAFNSSPEELGRAAVRAARKRGPSTHK